MRRLFDMTRYSHFHFFLRINKSSTHSWLAQCKIQRARVSKKYFYRWYICQWKTDWITTSRWNALHNFYGKIIFLNRLCEDDDAGQSTRKVMECSCSIPQRSWASSQLCLLRYNTGDHITSWIFPSQILQPFFASGGIKPGFARMWSFQPGFIVQCLFNWIGILVTAYHRNLMLLLALVIKYRARMFL